MFTSIKISNYRSCADLTIEDLGPIVALLGRNGAGKSNILRAIAFIAALTSEPTLPPMQTHVSAHQTPRFSFECRLDRAIYKFKFVAGEFPTGRVGHPVSMEETLSIVEGGLDRVLLYRKAEDVKIEGRDDVKIGSSTSACYALKKLLPSEDPVVKHLEIFTNFLAGVHYYGTEGNDDLDETFIVTADQFASWSNEYRENGKTTRSVNLRLIKLFNEKKEQFEELCSLMGDSGLGLVSLVNIATVGRTIQDVQAPSVEDMGPEFYLVRFQPGTESPAVGFSDLSFGTQRILRLLTSLIFDKSSTMLIEQPEDGIHAGLTRKLFGILRCYTQPSQLIFASHSTVLFNELKPEEVRLVMRQKGKTTTRSLTTDERDAAKAYLADEGTMADFISNVESE